MSQENAELVQSWFERNRGDRDFSTDELHPVQIVSRLQSEPFEDGSKPPG